jgi:3-hydroxyisobutyrate dehydrogenase-like beta-hydroxyacid dehydrogenase
VDQDGGVQERERELPRRPVVGVLHPGMMGAAVGSALKPAAGVVIWAAAGRSITTSKRAELADLVSVPDLAELARRADLIVSVCPPEAAREVAGQVAAALENRPDRPLYLDANAVAPGTVRAIGELLGSDRVVDGAVIGPPPWEPGHTVLWLSGTAAPAVAGLFDGSPFAARVLGPELGTASALKACFALQSKALPTIWLAMAEAADGYGVREQLRAELARMGADETLLDGPSPRAAAAAWRWAGEMDEAAEALLAVGVPDGFSRAAAEMYRRLADARPVDRSNEWGLRGTAC